MTEELSIAYDEDTSTVADLLTAVAHEDDRILDEPEPDVDVIDLGDSAVRLAARFWIDDPKTTDIAAIHTDFNSRAKDRLLEEGVTVAPAAQQELSGQVGVQMEEGNSSVNE